MRILSRMLLALLLGFVADADAGEEPAQLVIIDGKVLTLDEKSTVADALAMRDGIIVARGQRGDVENFIGPDTRVINASGKTVIPGLIESHVHALRVARGEIDQAYVQLGSIAEIQDWVQRQARAKAAGHWIQIPRADVTRIVERRMPTRAELDAAAPDHPVVFTWQYASRQRQVLNSAALQSARLDRKSTAPPGVTIERDEAGEPTGVLENGAVLLDQFLPASNPSEQVRRKSLLKLLRHYARTGITSIFERNTDVDGYRFYEKLAREGALPLRVTTTIGLETDGTVGGTKRAIAALGLEPGQGNDRLRVGPLKIGVDGGVLYGTAFLRDPYGERSFGLYGFSDPTYRGNLRIAPDKLGNILRAGNRLGWQMSTHVTGDAGVDTVLDAVEATDASIRKRRFTLIHAYFANAEAAKRAASLGVGVDTQPAWYYKDGDALSAALGSSRLEKFIGLRVWRQAGVPVTINADHMQGIDPDRSLNPYNPFLTMYAAVSRRTEAGAIYGADQRISREEALRMMTIDAAWFSFDENKKGSIEVGKLGDVAILSEDPLTCDENRLARIRSIATIVGGEVVHEE